MPRTFLPSQVLLAATIFASTVGTYIASRPPNPNPSTTSTSTSALPSDLLTTLKITNHYAQIIALLPLWFFSLHTSLLGLFHPTIPLLILGHGATNALNHDLITWTPSTAIPLSLLLGLAIPLRLHSYSTLGRNFTFALAPPDGLTTTGVYAWVQHPSYVGLVSIVLLNVVLLGRTDGVMTCWFPPSTAASGRWWTYRRARRGMRALVPVVVAAMMAVMWARVVQEEEMLRVEFGKEWEVWHARTARFVPGLF